MMSRCAFGCGGIGDLEYDLSAPDSSSMPISPPRESTLLTATSAQGVRLVMALSERTRTLRYMYVLAI
jgi:hypothetical protein